MDTLNSRWPFCLWLSGKGPIGRVKRMESEIERYEGFVRDFQAEVERRKYVLDCYMNGYWPDDWLNVKLDIKVSGVDGPYRLTRGTIGWGKEGHNSTGKKLNHSFSAEAAKIHLDSIGIYEEVVEICEEALEQLRIKEGSQVEPKVAPTE